jgi:hypothetical protein
LNVNDPTRTFALRVEMNLRHAAALAVWYLLVPPIGPTGHQQPLKFWLVHEVYESSELCAKASDHWQAMTAKDIENRKSIIPMNGRPEHP